MSTIETINTASNIQMNYMKLLVTELQNQDPLEPLNNKEMAAQLAQFSQLQQLETANNKFDEVLSSVERAYAGSLLGKNISFPVETETGDVDAQTGAVKQVFNDADGQVFLIVDGQTVGLDEVISVIQ